MKLIHYPRLDTVLMVENFIKEHSGEYKKKALWQSLPKKMMYQTYCVIIDYLETHGRIAFDRLGVIGWVWNPEKARYYAARTDLDPERFAPEAFREYREKQDKKRAASAAGGAPGTVRDRNDGSRVRGAAARGRV